MVKEEIWSVALERVQAFFCDQPDVTAESNERFRFRSCRILLTELAPGGTGIWAAKRTKLSLEGEAADVETIYRRYFIQFLSTGG